MFYSTILSGLAQIHQLGVTLALDTGHVYSRNVCVCVCKYIFQKQTVYLRKFTQSYLKRDEVRITSGRVVRFKTTDFYTVNFW